LGMTNNASATMPQMTRPASVAMAALRLACESAVVGRKRISTASMPSAAIKKIAAALVK
jgi:hypothetical protein